MKKKNSKFAVSCLLALCVSLSAKVPLKEQRQHMKDIMLHIQALNTKADQIIQQRDRLTAHLRFIEKRYREKS